MMAPATTLLQLLVVGAYLGLPTEARFSLFRVADKAHSQPRSPRIREARDHIGSGKGDVVGGIYYVNMATSTERRQKMEEHLRKLQVHATRLEGVRFDATRTGNYSDKDKAVLSDAFGSWSCGSWAQGRCQASDQACCWGFTDALQMTEHCEANKTGWAKVRGTTFLAAAAAKILALKGMKTKCESDAASCLPTVLLEDDARLHENWTKGVTAATEVLGSDGFDMVRMYGVTRHGGDDHCVARCSASGQCFDEFTESCWSWGNTALLVNPRRVDKILGAIEAASKYQTELHYAAKSVVMRDRFSMDNLLLHAAQQRRISLFWARPDVVSVDPALDKKSTFTTGLREGRGARR